MAEKRSKYDTDPLDPDFVRRAEERMGGATAQPTGDVPPTRPTGPAEARPGFAREDGARRFGEETTRRLEEPPAAASSSYPSVFVPPVYQPPAANYTPYNANVPPPVAPQSAYPPPGVRSKPTSRPVQGLGLPENVSMVLPYVPFYIGAVASLVELLLVPRAEHRVRFHAAQGLALQIAILLISFAFGLLRFATGSGFGGWLFSLAANVFLVVSIIRVWQGERHHVAPLDDFTRRINQQIEPRNNRQ